MNRDTYDKLMTMKLIGMAEEYKNQDSIPNIHEFTFEQRFNLMVDAEYDSKYNRAIERLIHNAKLNDSKASISQIHYYEDRHLNREQLERLATNKYIERHENVLIIGATGSGKSYIASALGISACNGRKRVRYIRLPDLLAELQLSKVQGTYKRLIKQYERCDLLIIDEWLLVNTTSVEQQDILEILEVRYRVHSTIFCSQFEVGGWHQKLGGGALADAILDRIIPRAHTIKIDGLKSMRTR